MLPRFLVDVRFFALLAAIDLELTLKTRLAGCPRCGGALHSSPYKRALRGVPDLVADRFEKRKSLCCARTGCRKRALPPSVVFLERKVYAFAVVVLVSALREGVTPRRALRLKALFGVSRRTIERWREEWRRIFADGDLRTFLGGLAGKAKSLPDLLLGLRRKAARTKECALLSALLLLVPLSTSGVDPGLSLRWALETRRGGLWRTP